MCQPIIHCTTVQWFELQTTCPHHFLRTVQRRGSRFFIEVSQEEKILTLHDVFELSHHTDMKLLQGCFLFPGLKIFLVCSLMGQLHTITLLLLVCQEIDDSCKAADFFGFWCCTSTASRWCDDGQTERLEPSQNLLRHQIPTSAHRRGQC